MAASHQDRSAIAAEISREIVRLHARHFGRGPTRAKTFVYDHFALCMLEDVLTRGEKTLVETGHEEPVRATRRAFHDVVREDFIALIENATGREVRAFMSQLQLEPEVAIEVFIFEPEEPRLEEEDGTPGEDSASAE